MEIAQNIIAFKKQLPENVTLVAVSKTKPISAIEEAYKAGQLIFGENYVQELIDKHQALPKDIEWHFIGHLQSNKVKFIAPFVHLIHGVDSFKLLKEIDKEAKKNKRIINCLLQVHIASEETKFGLSDEELKEIIVSPQLKELKHIALQGLMGMASNTDDKTIIKNEFLHLKGLFEFLKTNIPSVSLLSMGMSSDYQEAIACGGNLIRIGSALCLAAVFTINLN
jgi:PLP dependent protein